MIVALLALSVALGGSAYAALSASSVKSSHIKNKTVRAQDLKKGAVKKAKIKPGAVNTKGILDGTVQAIDLAAGTVPASLPPSGNAGGSLSGSYPNPGIANNAIGSDQIANGSITAADLDPGALVGCPTAAPTASAGVCYSGSQTAVTWDSAVADCSSDDLRLPGTGELEAIYADRNNQTEDPRWTSDYVSGVSVIVLNRSAGLSTPAEISTAQSRAYICVA